MRDFENRDVVRILGVHPKTLIDWSMIGLVTPTVEATGTGTRRRYSERNLVELAIIQTLLADGIKRDIVQAIAQGFDEPAADGPLSLREERANTETLYLHIDLETRSARWATVPHAESEKQMSFTQQIADAQAKLHQFTHVNAKNIPQLIRLLTECSVLLSEQRRLTDLGASVLETERTYTLNVSKLKEHIRERSPA
jgi:DNA-binding transcriptional MerR regulator